jgi:endoglucanase
MGKAYLVDGTKAGIFPRTPNDPMIKVLPLAGEPKRAYYLEDWDKAKGYTQPAAIRSRQEHHVRGR